MAAHLLDKGFEVRALRHRSREPAARLERRGARICDRIADAVSGCDIAVLCLPTSREVEAVVESEAASSRLRPPAAWSWTAARATVIAPAGWVSASRSAVSRWSTPV